MRHRHPATPSVSKRDFLSGMGLGMSVLALSSARAVAAETGIPDGQALPPLAGSLNLDEVPVIDAHVHPLSRALISTKYEEQAVDFTNAMLPPGDYPDKEAMRARLLPRFREQVMGVSRRVGYFDYVARIHGVPPTQQGFDAALAPHIGSDAAFAVYVRSALDRAKIAGVVLQSRGTEPVRPASAIPDDRFVWTFRFTDMAGAEWANSRGYTRLSQVTAEIDRYLQQAVRNGCRGFKNSAAYSRPLSLQAVTAVEAERALAVVLPAKPARQRSEGPIYDDPQVQAALRTYEDFIFRHVYVRCGELDRPVVLHSAVALHPALRPGNNDPEALYGVLTDPAIVRAGTRFVVIHTGYPNHHVLAAMNSQFPQMFVDVSHISKYPGALDDTLRALIALGPTAKVMHGSDAGTIPEEIAYCAFNTRQTLARILSEYKQSYGWRQDDILIAANQILHQNARQVFGMA